MFHLVTWYYSAKRIDFLNLNMLKRKANEKKFQQWTDSDGGRLYQRKVLGRKGWYAIYCKEVDKEENTIRFWQEIFDENNQLREIHKKFPLDKGHQKINTP